MHTAKTKARGKAPEAQPNEGPRSATPVHTRIPDDILTRIDRAARRLGLTRSGFMISSAVEKVDRLERKGG
jgi:uncharacterized protein (DUF1778 family)